MCRLLAPRFPYLRDDLDGPADGAYRREHILDGVIGLDHCAKSCDAGRVIAVSVTAKGFVCVVSRVPSENQLVLAV